MSVSSLYTLLSKANKYTWHFSIEYNPSNISVMAFSVEEARQQVLTQLRKISYLSAEYKRLEESGKNIQYGEWVTSVKPKLRALENQLNIDNNVGCYCLGLFDYIPTLAVECGGAEMTLEKLVSEVVPTVSKINTMSVFSCLDG
jgi:hypothetical protein